MKMSWDKVRIYAKSIRLDIDDLELTFSLVEDSYDSDGDRTSGSYSVKDLILSAEEHREKRDIQVQENWIKYQTELKKAEKVIAALRSENDKLTTKLKELMLR
jgi:hypothetical protein